MKKVVVIGPESTGKTTLCKQLATYFQTQWCPEFAREYLLEHGMDYSYDDLLTIAKGQVALEEKYTSNLQPPTSNDHSLLFIDTDMYVMKIWCEFVFGKCHQFILDQIASRKYDLYFLCNIDLPWIKDELREYPDVDRRKQLYNIYTQTMTNQTTPWIDISGSYDERLQKAIAAVANMLD